MGYGPYKEYVVKGAILNCPANMLHQEIELDVSEKKIKYQNKPVATENDKRIKIALGYCLLDKKRCCPNITSSQWENPRGRAAKIKTAGHYQLVEDATIKCIKGCSLKFVKSGQVPLTSLSGLNKIHLSKDGRTIGFAIRHPFKASTIGSFKSGSNNISTIAVLYANGLGLKNTGSEGSQVNAFRHVMWQAIITNEYGSSIAHQVGNAHEHNPLALTQIEAVNQNGIVYCKLLTLAEADELIDLKNNIIGRRIGSEDSSKNNDKLANIILDEFKNNGLYVAHPIGDTGYYGLDKEKITQQEYDKAKQAIENGLDPKDKTRQNKRG